MLSHAAKTVVASISRDAAVGRVVLTIFYVGIIDQGSYSVLVGLSKIVESWFKRNEEKQETR